MSVNELLEQIIKDFVQRAFFGQQVKIIGVEFMMGGVRVIFVDVDTRSIDESSTFQYIDYPLPIL